MNVTGQQGYARLDRAVAVGHLKHDRDQEQQPAQRCVHDERHRVGRGELPRPEHLERQHRRLLFVLDPHEQAEQGQPQRQRYQHRRRTPAVRGGRDQPVGDPGQRAADARGPLDVQLRHRTGRLGLGYVPGGDGHDHHGQRQVDEEHQPPGHRAYQPPAQERPDRGGHAAQARPGADGGRSVVLGRRTPAGWPGCRGSAAPRRRPAGPGPRSAPPRSGPARTAMTQRRTTRCRSRTASGGRSCRRASRRAAAARPGSACTRRPPTAALATPAWKSRPMAGSAMPTTVASRAAMPEPSTVAATTQRPRALFSRRPPDPAVPVTAARTTIRSA